MSEWFSDWFNSEEYLLVYKNRNEKEANQFADSIMNFFLSNNLLNIVSVDSLNAKPAAKTNLTLLDLACGFGRHSLTFAQRGFEVVGIDISSLLLNIAKKRANEINLHSVNFLQCDIRDIDLKKTPYYPTPNGFDVAINVFTSFGYFENDDENFLIFKKAAHHIKDGGFFIFDFLNSVYIRNNLIEVSETAIEGLLIKQTRKIVNDSIVKEIIIPQIAQNHDIATLQKTSSCSFTMSGNTKELVTSDSINQSKVYKEIVKLYSPTILIEKLKETGLYPIAIWGNYLGDSFDEMSSERFIAICRKK